jgi:hypothetical protein
MIEKKTEFYFTYELLTLTKVICFIPYKTMYKSVYDQKLYFSSTEIIRPGAIIFRESTKS